jgi:serine/threonine protein kinase
MSLSLYKTKELGSGSRRSHSAAQYADHSFIALLALAQRLEVPFLPITWQALLDNLGQGGQAKVSQAAANVQTSFAFKLFRGDSVDNADEDTPFQAVINEMIMLSHRAIRDHPFVVTLEGICWDIPGDGDQVWPVLVFEKSIHGDLFEFVKSGRGSSLSTQEKLKLCTDIGIAIRDMHSNSTCLCLYIEIDITHFTDIIHGDIKPQNVLIFPNEDHGFVAKMADFGFSIGFQRENDRIFLPESRPWNPPEHHNRHFFPEEAKRMDIYSFGLLCFWLLFGTSDQLPLAPWMQYENAESISFEGSESLDIFECLKKNEDDNLLRWIAWLIDYQEDFNDSERNDLKQFFRFTLVRKSSQRNMDFDVLLSSLTSNRLEKKTVLIIYY